MGFLERFRSFFQTSNDENKFYRSEANDETKLISNRSGALINRFKKKYYFPYISAILLLNLTERKGAKSHSLMEVKSQIAINDQSHIHRRVISELGDSSGSQDRRLLSAEAHLRIQVALVTSSKLEDDPDLEDQERSYRITKMFRRHRKRCLEFFQNDKKDKKEEKTEIENFMEKCKREFLFRHYWKTIGWTLLSAILLACFISLVVEGLQETRTYDWLNKVFLSWVFSFFLLHPLKMLLRSAIRKYVFEFKKDISYKHLDPFVFENPHDENKYDEVIEIRHLKKDCYENAQHNTTKWRRLRVRNAEETRNLIIDVGTLFFFMLFLYLVVMGNLTSSAFFSTQVMRNIVVKGLYTDGIPLTEVRTHTQFFEYISKTFIPALLTPNPVAKTATISEDGELITQVMDRGWTRDPSIKLIGIPRFRQIRVAPVRCYVHPSVPADRGTCWSELSVFNQDTNNYSMSWEKPLPGEMFMSEPELEPWRYKNAWETGAAGFFGRFYHMMNFCGGYLLTFGKNTVNAKVIVDFMINFNWIDQRTRAVIIDFVAYSQNANLYNVVSVIVEISATGVFIPSYKIYTDRFFQSNTFKYQITIVLFTALAFAIFLFAVREWKRIREIGWKIYFTNGWATVEFLIVLIGIGTVIATIVDMTYISHLLSQLDAAANNQHISFQYAVLSGRIRTTFSAILVALVTLKVFHLLSFMVVIDQWEQVLKSSWKILVGLFVVILFTAFIFSIYFSLLQGDYEENMSSLWFAFPSMLAHTTRGHDQDGSDFLEISTPYIAAYFIAALLFYASCIMVSIFSTLLTVHLKAAHQKPVRGHFRLRKYLKSFKEDSFPPASELEPELEPIQLNYQGHDFVPPPFINEVRLQGMKRVTLQVLSGRDFGLEMAQNIAQIVLTGNSNRPATDKYYIIRTDPSLVIAQERLNAMKKVADKIINERNDNFYNDT